LHGLAMGGGKCEFTKPLPFALGTLKKGEKKSKEKVTTEKGPELRRGQVNRQIVQQKNIKKRINSKQKKDPRPSAEACSHKRGKKTKKKKATCGATRAAP